MSTLPATGAAVLNEGMAPPGLQLYGSVNGSCLGDVAFGMTSHGPMTSRTLHALWCQVKPIVAMVAARLAEEGGWPPDATLAELGVNHGRVPTGTLTLADILSHRTGIADPPVTRVKMIPPAHRAAMFSDVGGPTFPSRRSSVYSEYATWELLGQFIRQRTGRPVVAYLQDLVDRYEIEDLVFQPTTESFETWESRVGCYYSLDQPKAIPFLHDYAPSYVSDFLAGSGGYASMRALGGWYEDFLDVLRGRAGRRAGFFPTPSYVHDLIARRRGRRYDEVLDCHVDFAAGLLCSDLSALHFGSAPAAGSMAHFGWSWSSWTLVDPVNGIVLCALHNGITTRRGAWDDARRATVDAIYRDSHTFDAEPGLERTFQ